MGCQNDNHDPVAVDNYSTDNNNDTAAGISFRVVDEPVSLMREDRNAIAVYAAVVFIFEGGTNMEFCVGIIDDDNGFVELRTVEDVYARIYPEHYDELNENGMFDGKGNVRWEKLDKMEGEKYFDLQCRGFFTELVRVETMFNDIERMMNWARWEK